MRSIADCGSLSRALHRRPDLAKPPSGQVQRLWRCIHPQPPKMIFLYKSAEPALGCTTVGKDVPKNFWYFLQSENTQKRIPKICRKTGILKDRASLPRAEVHPADYDSPFQPPKMIIRPINAILQDCAACGGPPWAFLRRPRPTKSRRAPAQPYSEKPLP